MENWNNKQTKELLQVILNLKNLTEAERFFRDLLTKQEIIEFGKRWQVARLLSEKVSYSEIEKITGLSSTTIARISKWLNKGMGGYKLAIANQSHHSPSLNKKGLSWRTKN